METRNHPMINQRWSFSLVLFFISLILQPAFAALPDAVNGKPLPTLAPILDNVMPGVVNVATRGHVKLRQNPLFDDPFFRHFFGNPGNGPRERETQSLGSGVIIDANNGYIMTNHHVIANADEITISLRDGRKLEAKLVGADPDSDVAIVQVKEKNLTAIPLADSDKLRVGDFVVAIGNPFGLGQTVTSGIVSALGRGIGLKGYENFIQTDASINPGNSGGALINLHGELVGINTAIFSRSGGNIGIGFAIPINMAHQIMQQLVEHGEVSRGRLGVVVQDLTPELASAFKLQQTKGAVIAQVVKGASADKAGLKVGDIVIKVNNKKVTKSTDLRNAIGLVRIGDKVTLDILRNGKTKTLHAVIAEPHQEKLSGKKIHPRLEGATLGNIEEDSPLYGKVEGVQLVEVERGSPAAITGLRPGDIITSLNREDIKDLDTLNKIARKKQNALLMNIQRGNTAMFIVIQ